MKIVLIVFLLLQLSLAQTLTKGEVEIFYFENEKPQAVGYDGVKKLPVIKHPKKGYFYIVPVNYKENKKEVRITTLLRSGTHKKVYKINDGHYKKEVLSVDSSKVHPPKNALKRIRSEYNQAMKIYKSTTASLLFDKTFILPLDSNITSTFGNARTFNDTLKSYHSGTDFKAKVGTPVKAVNDGVVVIAKDRYYAGGSIVIDHGYGIYSTYYHLSRIDKKVGGKVKRGEIVGLSGKSGRVTGPHLHFGIMVGGYAVNPLDFIKKINATF